MSQTHSKLTFGGDWSREILRDEGTGFGSDIGSVLGRGGLGLDGCCLLYLQNKEIERKFCIVIIEKWAISIQFPTHFLS
jgi:hypothetical protein